MKIAFTLLLCFLVKLNAFAQLVQIDLANKDQIEQSISLDKKGVRLINKLPAAEYKIVIESMVEKIPAFSKETFQSTKGDEDLIVACNTAKKNLNTYLDVIRKETKSESKLSEALKKAEKYISDTVEKDNAIKKCGPVFREEFNALKNETVVDYPFEFNVEKNQIITVRILRLEGDKETKVKTVVLKTPQSTPWLTHFGLTYAPQIISKATKYYAKADETAANKYTITEQNNQTPKTWENISVTANFTYLFSLKDDKRLNAGWTAGFGLGTDLQLSGHTGISAIIGTNVILGTGIAFMQKYNLKGEYAKGQMIKENLSFESLHEKVWRPEIYFTIGFRFDKNPFGGAGDKKETTPEKKPAAN